MKYWVIKGNPKWYKWDNDLEPGCVERWGARTLPDEFAADDRLFLWESGGRKRIIGFGEVVRIHPERNDDGRRQFTVRYLTSRLQVMPKIRDLKKVPALRTASFLQAGPFATVYALRAEQADTLYQIVVRQNYQDHIWRDLGGIQTSVSPPDVDSESWEGNPKMVTHLRRERDPQLAKRKKDQFRRIHRKLFCEACGCDHCQYGRLSKNVFEVHHLRPIAKRQKAAKTKLSDLGVLCSNCHRAIHRTKPMCSIADFRILIES